MGRRRSMVGVAVGVIVLLLGVPTGQGWALTPTEAKVAYGVRLKSFDWYGYRSPETDRRASETGGALSKLYGGDWVVTSWNPQTNTPHFIAGSGADLGQALTLDADVVGAARTVVGAAALALGVDPADLRLDRVTRGMGKTAAHFQQTYHGLDVYNGRAFAIFTETGRLFVLGSDFYSGITVDPQPTISAARAEDIARRDLQSDPATDNLDGDPKLIVLPEPLAVNAVRHRLAWRVRMQTEDPFGIWVTYVDAHSGGVVWRYDEVRTEYLGDTYTRPEPVTYCNGEVQHGIAYMYVSIPGLLTMTDANGHWHFIGGGVTTVSERFSGDYCYVDNLNGPNAQYQNTIVGGVPDSHIWDDTNSAQDERDVFDAVSDIHDFFETFDPGFQPTNSQVYARIGRNDGYCPCNAWEYDIIGDGYINFCRATPSCANTGTIQGAVDHEYGHFVNSFLVGHHDDDPGAQGLDEANADVLGNLMTRESIIGRGVDLNCAAGWRDSQNNLIYPDDVVGQEAHAAGRVLAGFHWDATQLFRMFYGDDAGILLSAERWHAGRELIRPATYQPDQVLATFIADDDDGDLLNGTPHFGILCLAARNHNFICPGDVVVDFNYTGAETGTFDQPFNTLSEGVSAVVPGRHVTIKAGSSSEMMTITKPMTIDAYGGTATIGQ